MLRLKKLTAVLCSCLLFVVILSSCGQKTNEVIIPEEDGWFSIWATAPQIAEYEQIPTNPGFAGNTCRQVIRASIGGNKIKLTFSNEYGSTPLVIESVHIAKLLYTGNPAIDPATDTVVTFGGKNDITIQPGKTAVTDEISFEFAALDNIAVSMKIGEYTGGDITCHRTANTSSWIVEGDRVGDESFGGVKVMNSWYYLVNAQTWASAGTKTLVCLGDSITDRACCTFNQYNSWTDQLDNLLKANPETSKISVVNMGIGGNMLSGDYGDPAVKRLERDVLNIPGVRYVVLLIGINDVGTAQADISQNMIADYKSIIDRCHEKGIKVYAGTLTPVKGNFYYSELHETIRWTVNDFIMSEDSGFDGVIDFASAIAREDDPSQMRDEYCSPGMDYLHPGDEGYKAMAQKAYDQLVWIWKNAEVAAEK